MMIQNDVLDTAKLEGRIEGLAEGRAKGLEEGRAKGLEEGRAKERLDNAHRMKSLGVSFDIISQVTGLAPEEIEKLS